MGLASANVQITLDAAASGTNALGSGGLFEPTMSQLLTFAAGTAASQADLYYIAERTVGDGANDDIDLAGTLENAFGEAVVFAELCALLLINKPVSAAAVNTTDLTLGGGSNPVTPGFLGGTTPTVGPLKPGAFFCMASTNAAGIGVVTATTADILRITNAAGATNTYQLGILGRSA